MVIVPFRFSVFILSIHLFSSFIVGDSASVVKRKYPDYKDNQSQSALIEPTTSITTDISQELNSTTYVREKKSTGLSPNTLFNFVPRQAQYESMNKIWPAVMRFMWPIVIRSMQQSPRAQSLQQPGGIAFPSLEGALLSLAFLTFAVFLVDLVQQVLGRLRTGTGTVPLAGRRFGGGRRRRRRRSMETFEGLLLDDKFGQVFSTLSSNIITAIENPLNPDMNKMYK